MVEADRVTASHIHLWAPGVSSATAPLHEGEPCGDAALWLPAGHGGGQAGLLCIVDGLGHGAPAAAAAQAVLARLRQWPDASAAPLQALMAALDRALAGLRGAAVGLVQLGGGVLRHAGVGNTRMLLVRGERTVRLPSQNGIVGGGLPARLQVAEHDVLPGDWLLLFTDGLDECLSLPVQLPEWQRDPGLLCRYVMRQHRQGRDDRGVLVMLVGRS